MLNLKKTAVAVLALGSSAVFAGTMGPVCTPGNVSVPCERTAWEFGAQALYLKPIYNNSFGYRLPVAADAATTVDTYRDADLDWGWGFRVSAAYQFNTGNDFNVNWSRLSKTTRFNQQSGIGTLFVPTSFNVQPKWDQVNVEFGQHVDFGDFKNIRFHGGLQYARIQSSALVRNYVSNAVATTATPQGTYSTVGNLKFNGVGPRIGADMSYDFGNGFAVYGNGATSLLVGDTKVNYSSTVVPRVDGVRGSKTAIVPEIEAKLGLTYTYAMAQGDVSLDAGWSFINYFNAQNSGSGTTDFGLQGPYVGMKWVGNV